MKKIIVFILSLVIVLSATACSTAPAEENQNTSEIIGTTSFYGMQFEINGTIQTINDYSGIEDSFVLEMHDKGYNNIDIYDTKDITENLLESRTESDRLIVERAIGIVTNRERQGDGKILNTDDDYYNYISYRNVDFNTCDGTIVLTYLIYNPDTSYTDDIIERYDFCLDRNFED